MPEGWGVFGSFLRFGCACAKLLKVSVDQLTGQSCRRSCMLDNFFLQWKGLLRIAAHFGLSSRWCHFDKLLKAKLTFYFIKSFDYLLSSWQRIRTKSRTGLPGLQTKITPSVRSISTWSLDKEYFLPLAESLPGLDAKITICFIMAVTWPSSSGYTLCQQRSYLWMMQELLSGWAR